MLIEHLPPESATMTALRNAHPESVTEDGPDPAEGRWSQVEMLLADVVDELRNLRYVYTASQSEKNKNLTPPDPIRRPGVQPKRKKNELSDAQYDWLYRHINGQQEPGAGFVDVAVELKPVTHPT